MFLSPEEFHRLQVYGDAWNVPWSGTPIRAMKIGELWTAPHARTFIEELERRPRRRWCTRRLGPKALNL